MIVLNEDVPAIALQDAQQRLTALDALAQQQRTEYAEHDQAAVTTKELPGGEHRKRANEIKSWLDNDYPAQRSQLVEDVNFAANALDAASLVPVAVQRLRHPDKGAKLKQDHKAAVEVVEGIDRQLLQHRQVGSRLATEERDLQDKMLKRGLSEPEVNKRLALAYEQARQIIESEK